MSSYETAICPYFSSGRCGSCSLLSIGSGHRRSSKITQLESLLREKNVSPISTEPLVGPPDPWGSRSKVKMVAGGTTNDPRFGIVTANYAVEDLSECPLHRSSVSELLDSIKEIVRRRRIPIYDIASRRGELKAVIIVQSKGNNSGLVRFVLRSTECVDTIRNAIPNLRQKHPWIQVASCNIQPLPAAILEGPEEIILTSESLIQETYRGVSVYLAPQSFVQVTPETAAALYARAANEVSKIRPATMLDLYCGVGGFSLSSAPFATSVHGVELSEVAVLCARRAAAESNVTNVTFAAENVDTETNPCGYDLVLVNPPRRGLSDRLVDRLGTSGAEHIIYSSCNPESLVRDLSSLTSGYTVETIAPFDMFPMTPHLEVLAVLKRVPS